jgi:hypothetical protein
MANGSKKFDFLPWLAIKHHKTHKDKYLDFKKYSFQKQIYHDKNPYLVIIKSTQNGISEYLFVRAIAHAIRGMRVFYVLPTFELLKRAVDERYTKSVQNTDYYKALARAAREQMLIKQSDSVRSKDIGLGNIAYVNSFSSIGFTEYAADEVIIDELDKCDQDNIAMAWERLSNSEYRFQAKISNPTYKGCGIDLEYDETDKKEYYCKCTAGHFVRPDWFKHVVEQTEDKRFIIRDPDFDWQSGKDIKMICECGKPIDRNSQGEWVKTVNSPKSGYRLTKLFSGSVSIIELMDRFNKGLTNDTILQRFYNADLGEAFTAKGSKIDEEMIAKCVSDYRPGYEEGLNIIGIDVGSYYNYVISQMQANGKIKVLTVGEVKDTKELTRIMKEYKIKVGVIDALPETREAKKISNMFPLVYLCYYGQGKSDSINMINKVITVQRTSALDAVKEAILTNTILYPINILGDKTFLKQMTAAVRVFNADKKQGSQKGAYEWVEGNQPDHYFHALAYNLIARRLVLLLNKGK